MKVLLIAIGILAVPVICVAEQTVNFNRDVRPILSDRCFQCHGPAENDREADLRLDQANGPEGAYRTLDESRAIKPGSIEDSALWYRITTEDDDVMPPPDSSKQPLTADEKAIIKRWIEEGAEYADFWAFVPPRMPDPPAVQNEQWSQRPIDRFVLRRLESQGLAPKPRADRRTLIRRLSLDLTGLPPTREEIRSFLSDTSADSYERIVDRVLNKPQYGEHMTKYWLDLVRFADTNGIHHDHYREMTPYRDWVIRAFNGNLPYDEFVKYQLAGDLYPKPTHDQFIASGFNRLHLIIDRGTALPEESFTRNVIDRITAVGTAFMGLTVQCAACHDHKYDPITMKDFYQLFAFFNNLDGTPETGGRQGTDFQRGLQPPYVSLASETEQAKLEELQHRIDDLTKEIPRIEQQVKEAGDEAQKKTLDEALAQAKQELKKVRGEKQTFVATIPVAMVMKEKADRRPAHILIRGAYDNPGEQVVRDSPAFLPPMKKKDGIKSRMDLAEWFVSAENPLTARVVVNRFWQQLFGVGIVKTAEDFGAQGDWPSHPDLLDHLAASLIESEWDVKALLKQIVMSETYQQESEATLDEFESDPENRLLSRGSRFRMDSEMIRDQLLATSGLLNYDLYGKSVKPPQPAGLWKAVSMPSSYPRVYESDTGEKIYRRSLYTFWKRGMPPPQMTILNAPSRESCIARRERTNTPLQALLLMNELEYLKAARHLAHETIADRALSPAGRLAIIYETITSKLPDAGESQSFLKMVEDLTSIYRDNSNLADQLCEGVELHEGVSTVELAAWTMLVSTINNLDITKTRG
ncbi:MAG: DUF1553 domain-containing protein [Pirellulaceae bacterium]|nr:DUF1553 domain-containing protein [Pirellulaceae bacterium]